MIIGNNATYKFFVSNYNSQNSKLNSSMNRLSTGERLNVPGDAPADLGISERFRAQVRNSEESGRVIQNAINLMQTTDTYMQEVHNILDRMSELAISAADGSKSQADRTNLDLEFQQLKSEIGRISESGKYNGLQINGKTSVAVYDTLDHKIKYTQADGTDSRELDVNFRDGNSAMNGIEYSFESSATNGSVGDFLFTDDGKSLMYVAQNSSGSLSAQKTLMKLDIESDTITTVALTSAGGTSATVQARLVMDDQGRVWVSDPSTNATATNKNFNVKLVNVDDMSLDAGGTADTNAWSGGVTLASAFSQFAVDGDSIYYIERSAAGQPLRFVKQSLYDSTDKQILVTDLSGSTYNLDRGETYVISADGQYIAFEDEDGTAGTLTVINTESGEKASLTAGTRTNSITALSFDANNNIFWTDTGGTSDENVVKRASIAYGAEPTIEDVRVIHNDTAGRLGAYGSAMAARGMGLSVSGGTPASRYEFQVGADANMTVDFVSADVRLTKLGLSRLDVTTLDKAQTAIESIQNAVDQVANQRAVLGSQVSRLNFTYSANSGYGNNIRSAESRIRDVDIAAETAQLTQAQVMAQTSISILAQANSNRQNILRLLQ
jgi:flagellin